MEKRLGLLIKMFRRFNEKPEAFFLKARRLCKGLPGRPHDGPETTAQSGCNDRTIWPQRPHNPAPTTARFGLNDRTIQPRRPHNDRTIGLQRPHDLASTTAQSSPNDRTIRPQRPHDPAPTTAQCRKTEKKDDPSWQNTSRKVFNKRKKES